MNVRLVAASKARERALGVVSLGRVTLLAQLMPSVETMTLRWLGLSVPLQPRTMSRPLRLIMAGPPRAVSPSVTLWDMPPMVAMKTFPRAAVGGQNFAKLP